MVLSQIDGFTHLAWTQNLPSCIESYNSLTCLIGFPFSFNPIIYWFFFAVIIFVIMPFFLYWLTKRLDIIPAYFIFTSIPLLFDKLGFYSQFMLCFLLVFLIYAKNIWHKLIVALFFLITGFFGFILHRLQFELILVFFGIELFLFIENKFNWEKYFLFTFPFAIELREVGYSGLVTGSKFPLVLFYYGYHLLVRPMLFIFSIPAIIHIIVQKDWRKVCWLLVIVFGAIYLWFWESFKPLSILRMFSVLGFVLLIPFLEWLEKQKRLVKICFWFVGIVYFMFQFCDYFIFKVGG